MAGPVFAKLAVVVCDSVGCGDAPDAESFGDEAANTLGHVIAATGVALPNLGALGLARVPGVPLAAQGRPTGAWGRLTERGPGKDTMLGHWELMGVVATRPLPLYPQGFPAQVLEGFRRRTGREVLGNRAASGTEIIQELGAEHLRTARPIVYTSGDSVFQVAAHEDVIPPAELYRMCAAARELLTGPHAVGRVIARPFAGDPERGFRRTPGRRDYSLPPPSATVLDHLQAAGVGTYAVGKIHDIFAGRGIDAWAKTRDDRDGIAKTIAALGDDRYRFVFTNLVDFDSEFGHRNDPQGYGAALARLDAALPALLGALPADGCLVLTADHGNDPTTAGTDHTRERVPILVAGDAVRAADLGDRDFADLGATVLEALGVQATAGSSFLDVLTGPAR